MIFAKRLDALMSIAEVSNSKLGRAINMNGSHIGRLRNGVRKLPKKHDFIKPLCAYLARHIKEDYQATALSRVTGLNEIDISQQKQLTLFLVAWLTEKGDETLLATHELIEKFSEDVTKAPPAQSDIALSKEHYYYGNSGKRLAVERFFLEILEEDRTQTLCLFSDEDMLWLYEDKKFTERWFQLFMRVLQQGNKVKIIHTVRRTMGDLIEAIQKWMPLYLNGAIEPYYYPKLRDAIFQQTIFLAPLTAAVISSSVQFKTERMLNIYIDDKKALNSISEHYERFHFLCKPLMKIYKYEELEALLDVIKEVVTEPGELLISHQLPFLHGMPQAVFDQLVERVETAESRKIWRDARAVFDDILSNSAVTRVLAPPELIERSNQPIVVPLSDVMLHSRSEMSAAQYYECIDSLVAFSEKHDHYNIVYSASIPKDVLMLVKEGVGVISIKTTEPLVSFVFNEPNLIEAYCDYFKALCR